ncbi:class F sortase [Verrucosispora sp. NA02020]|uniref:class F sortase n=1 Tax=Verrucosispora sp. NA02020 TaxID=2742132 RepID=UPI001C37DB86|nr:class F sortase [Verrucosispora sp. NA02020]
MTITRLATRGGDRRRRTLPAVTAILTAIATISAGACSSGDVPVGAPPPPKADAAASSGGQRDELTTGPLMPSSPPTRVSIPSLKISAPTVPLGLQPDGTMQVPDTATDVGWYTKAPTPGALGPAVLAGHVNWKGHDGSFHDLAALAPGATLTVDREDGSRATFTVTKTERHPKDTFPTDAVYGPVDHAALRLITCGGPFDTARDSYRDNIIVYATLTHAQPA